MATSHIQYMQRCLELAKKGMGFTAPNPMVACVIVYQDKIIGEGFHQYYGGRHAEVEAISSVQSPYTSLLHEATLYVNLEPCSYYGKTPPCSHLIIEKGIKKVVVAGLDPNPKVAGSGIKHLEASGIVVIQGVLEKEARQLNKRFYTFHEKKRPYIVLKWAESTDGFIGRPDKRISLSNTHAQRLVHKWRSEEQAILIGYNTALIDNPKLNLRLWPGIHPVRILIDRDLSLNKNLNIFKLNGKLIVFSGKTHTNTDKVIYRTIDFSQNIENQILEILYHEDILSVLIEGGAKTLQGFIRAALWDEARVFTTSVTLKQGITAPVLKHHTESIRMDISGDSLTIYAHSI